MFENIKRESAALLARETPVARRSPETTPAVITETISRFAATITSEPPAFIAVVDDPCGLYGWCSDGVREKISLHGGKPLFGWTIWEWPKMFVTAEFHCVWRNDEGDVLDITPKPKGETRILFAADLAYPTDFNFDERPGNRRARIYQSPDRAMWAADWKENLPPARLEYEKARAIKAAVAFDEWALRKAPHDPLPKVIDDFLDACGAFETYLDAVRSNGRLAPDRRILELMDRRKTSQKIFQTAMKGRC